VGCPHADDALFAVDRMRTTSTGGALRASRLFCLSIGFATETRLGRSSEDVRFTFSTLDIDGAEVFGYRLRRVEQASG
jgi:hypothetical protein